MSASELPLGNRGLASHLIGRAVLTAGAEVLARAGIRLMPLKGIWLQHAAYADASERPITDVDVLVPDGCYATACSALQSAGWQLRGSNVSEASYRAPGWPLPLDVHKRLFSRAAFHAPTRVLFEHGRPDDAMFGVRVVLPDPLDVYAHLVGHFVKSRGAPEDTALRDFPALATACALDPQRCAARLDAYGLGRAARYVLPLTDDAAGFGARVVAALRPDPVGVLIAHAMVRLRTITDVTSPLAKIPGFALESSLGRAAAVLAVRAWDRRRDYQAPLDS